MKRSSKSFFFRLNILLFVFLLGTRVIATEFAGLVSLDTCIWGPLNSKAQVRGETIVLTGDVIVPEGITLTILPGTKVKAQTITNENIAPDNLFSGLELNISGTLLALGTREEPISFSGYSSIKGSWQGLFSSSGVLKLKNVIIEAANQGVFVSGGALEITDCVIRQNKTGITLMGWQNCSINNCLISENIDGIACASTSTLISNNTISNNDIGIHIMYGESGPTIINNHFENNHSFHIVNLATCNIIAYPNFWDRALDSLGSMLYDGYSEPEVGLILYLEPNN